MCWGKRGRDEWVDALSDPVRLTLLPGDVGTNLRVMVNGLVIGKEAELFFG